MNDKFIIMSGFIDLNQSRRGILPPIRIDSFGSGWSSNFVHYQGQNQNSGSRRYSKQVKSNSDHNDNNKTEQNEEETKLSKNYLRFMSDLTKQYILTNDYAIQFAKKWLQEHRNQFEKPKSSEKLYQNFKNWVYEKTQKLISAKCYREILSKQGLFETLYRTICFKFYEEDAIIYIMHHQLKKNQSSKDRDIVKHKNYALKNLWKMVWILKNYKDFKGISKIQEKKKSKQ